MGVAENVKNWKEMAKKKQELLAKSRNRVAFAWTLVALCCGSHTSHILHSLGIHVAHGNRIIILQTIPTQVLRTFFVPTFCSENQCNIRFSTLVSLSLV